MSTLTLTLKLPFYHLNQCKAQEFDRLTQLNTAIANQLLEIPKIDRRKYTSQDFNHIEIGSMWTNQTIRNSCAATKVKKFNCLPLEVNNQGWNIVKVGNTYSISFSLLRGVKKRVPLSIHQSSHADTLDKIITKEVKKDSLKLWKSQRNIWYVLLSVVLRSGMIGNYHVPLWRAVERAISSLTLLLGVSIAESIGSLLIKNL